MVSAWHDSASAWCLSVCLRAYMPWRLVPGCSREGSRSSCGSALRSCSVLGAELRPGRRGDVVHVPGHSVAQTRAVYRLAGSRTWHAEALWVEQLLGISVPVSSVKDWLAKQIRDRQSQVVRLGRGQYRLA